MVLSDNPGREVVKLLKYLFLGVEKGWGGDFPACGGPAPPRALVERLSVLCAVVVVCLIASVPLGALAGCLWQLIAGFVGWRAYFPRVSFD